MRLRRTLMAASCLLAFSTISFAQQQQIPDPVYGIRLPVSQLLQIVRLLGRAAPYVDGASEIIDSIQAQVRAQNDRAAAEKPAIAPVPKE